MVHACNNIIIIQHFPQNALQDYISSHLLPEDETTASLSPVSSMCPRLAMLDEPTLLELTSQSSISSIQVCYLKTLQHFISFIFRK